MKLRYQLCDFSIPFNGKKKLDQDSMQAILDSATWKSKLISHNTMGTISHKSRWEVEKGKVDNFGLPQSDIMVLDGTAANCVDNLWIEGTKLYCDLQVLNTPLGKRIEDLINLDKINPDVSMVIRYDEYPDRIKITDFIGVDFTFDPALQTELLATFSKSSTEQEHEPKNLGTYTKFMMSRSESKGISILCTNSTCEVIDDSKSETTQSELETYSLREFIRVRNRKPIQALQMIITDIKSYIGATKVEDLIKQRKLILEYLTNYLFTKISEILVDKDTKVVNLTMILGLNRFCDMKAIVEFQRICNMILRERKTMGYISKRYQQMLSKATNTLVMSILDKITKGMDESKRSIFMGPSKDESGVKDESKN